VRREAVDDSKPNATRIGDATAAIVLGAVLLILLMFVTTATFVFVEANTKTTRAAGS